jgi:hypothetical protein
MMMIMMIMMVIMMMMTTTEMGRLEDLVRETRAPAFEAGAKKSVLFELYKHIHLESFPSVDKPKAHISHLAKTPAE